MQDVKLRLLVYSKLSARRPSVHTNSQDATVGLEGFLTKISNRPAAVEFTVLTC